MARIPRKDIKEPFVHVMVQGINKEHIFNQEVNIKKYLKEMKKFLMETNILVIEYCIMSNHAHFLMYVKNMNSLTKLMHKVNLKFANYYNKKNDRVGYVFRERFKVQSIKTQEHLYMCIKYIRENPVKANICDNIEAYRYTGLNQDYFENKIVAENLIEVLLKMEGLKEADETNFLFIEEEQDKKILCKKLVDDFLNENEIELLRLIKNKKLLTKIVKSLSLDYRISFKIMEEIMQCSREKLRQLIR